jgi:hypothetical protein
MDVLNFEGCVDAWTGKADGVELGTLHPGLKDAGIGEVVGRFGTECNTMHVAAIRYATAAAEGANDTYAVLTSTTDPNDRDITVNVLRRGEVRINHETGVAHLGHLALYPETHWSQPRLGMLRLIPVNSEDGAK